MNSPDLVSVLIRTKDRKVLLQEAIDSVLAQTHSAVEILIINDGGDDFSASFQTEHAAAAEQTTTNKAIRWINNSSTHGRSHAANLALAQAQGEYCLFLDDDDSIDPTHLENLLTALKNQDKFKLAYSAVRILSEGHAEAIPSFAYPFDPIRLMIENYIPIHSVLFERALLDEGYQFDPDFDRFEDWDFWLQIAQQHAFYFVNQCTATYRVDSNSGFGAKENADAQMDAYRLALYKKWLGRWNQQQLIELFNRGREFPRIDILESSADNLRAQIKEKDHFNDLLNNQVAEFKVRVATRDTTILAQQDTLTEIKSDLLEAEKELNNHRKLNQSLQEEIQVIYNSRSWKLTRPLRFMTKLRWFLRVEGISGLFTRLKIKLDARSTPLKKIATDSPISDQYSALDFPVIEKPTISIVIPVFNQFQYTFHCLKSIHEHSLGESFEIIVVDDCSSDKTQDMLSGISGIKVIKNEKNLGFIKSCNKGAASATGEFLVLLNNDIEVKHDWLAALLQSFTDFPDAGLVGARLVFADGTLQEAGGIVWRDGSAWNYGRGEDPNNPIYSYARQVDYCSGACLMIPLEDYKALGCFDEHYLPAYYEDTDLAFKVRQSGKKVYYQPNATLIHFEGISSGTDLNSGTKKYQQSNHEKFFARWQETLEHHRPNARLPHLEKERHIQKRILVIDARVLMPDHDSGSLRMFNILKILQKIAYKVTFLPSNLQYHEKYTPQMQALGFECLYVPYVRSVKKHLEEFGQQYDAVILSRADYAEKHMDDVKQYCPNAHIIFDTVDLHFLREQREAELTQDKLLAESAAMRKAQELSLARKADTTLVVSPVELALFSEVAPDVNVGLLSNIHQTYETGNGFDDRTDMLFIGNFEHPPNTDAMIFFLDEVFPLVNQQNPEIKLHIVGGHVPAVLKSRASEQVIISGFVDDIEPLFNSIKISIAPLRYGAGVKGKINSSMSYGVPMVVTDIAAEGMKLIHNKDILIADEPAHFASEILRLYSDRALWQALSEAGKKNIEEHFSFATAETQLRAVLPD